MRSFKLKRGKIAEPPPEPPASLAQRAIREAAEREALARLEGSTPADEAQQRIEHARAEAEARERDVVELDRRSAEELERLRLERSEPQHDALLAELRQAEEELSAHQEEEKELSQELAETEDRLSQSQRQMAEALERAGEKLREVERRAADAEVAERAERLALIRADESERAERLRHMLDRIAEAERKASSAEERARQAVEKISEPLPEIDASTIFGEPAADPAAQTATEAQRPPAPDSAGGPISINSATFQELRAIGLSATQTGRLLSHRERAGGFGSLDELDDVPGFPPGFLAKLKTRIRL